MTGAELSRAGCGARPRRGRRSSRRALRRHRGRTFASGARVVSSRTCGSRWRGPRSRATPSFSSTGRERSSPPRSATRADVPEPPPDEGRLPRYTWRDEYAIAPQAARDARPDGSGASTACSSTTTTTSTERPRFEPASRSTARTRWRSLTDMARGSSSGSLVTEVEIEPVAAARARLRRVPTLHRRVPDGCPRRAGHARRHEVPLVLDAGARADPRCVPRGDG